MNLEEYSQYKETLLHEQPGFAYNTYLCTIPQDFPRVDLHWHEQMEIIYVKKGSGAVTVGSVRCPVSAGSISLSCRASSMPSTVIPACGWNTRISSSPWSLWTTGSRTTGRGATSSARCGGERFTSRGRSTRGLRSTMRSPRRSMPRIDACSEKDDGYSLLVSSSLFRLFFALYTHRSREESLPPSPYADAIKQVLCYVQNNFAEPISVRKAASLIDYSEAHFMRVFRKETGVTFVEYLSDYRLRYAAYLLREGTESVSEIAALCGFDNVLLLHSAFKRWFRSPKQQGCQSFPDSRGSA